MRETAAPPSRCPICGRASVERFRPFCSLRCADADLGRWLTGSYRVPDDDGPDEEPGRPLDPDEGVR